MSKSVSDEQKQIADSTAIALEFLEREHRRREAPSIVSASPGDAVIYTRYSDPISQKESSIERQVGLAEQYAEQAGLKVIKTYYDRGETGTMHDRPGLEELLADAQARLFKILIIEDIDRVGRLQSIIHGVVETLQEAEVEIHSVRSGGAMSGPEVTIRGFLSFEERRKFLVRTQNGRVLGIAKHHQSSRAPFGHMRIPGQPGINHPHPERSKLVVKMYELADAGFGSDTIARMMSQLSPTPQECTDLDKKRELVGPRKRWAAYTIYKILLNPVNVGVLLYLRVTRDKTVKGRTKSGRRKRKYKNNSPTMWIKCSTPESKIIDADLWMRVIKRMRAHNRASRKGTKEAYGALFAGKVFCGHAACGAVAHNSVGRLGPTFHCSRVNDTCEGFGHLPQGLAESGVLGELGRRLMVDGTVARTRAALEAECAERRTRAASTLKDAKERLRSKLQELRNTELQAFKDRMGKFAAIVQDQIRDECTTIDKEVADAQKVVDLPDLTSERLTLLPEVLKVIETPFKPKRDSADQLGLFVELRNSIHKIVVSREDKHRFRLDFSIDLSGGVPSADSSIDMLVPMSTVIDVAPHLAKNKAERKASRDTAIREKAASAKLDDDLWAAIEPEALRTRAPRDGRVVDWRQTIEDLLFCLGTQTPFRTLLNANGNDVDQFKLDVKRLVSGEAWAKISKIIATTRPSLFASFDLRMMDNFAAELKGRINRRAMDPEPLRQVLADPNASADLKLKAAALLAVIVDRRTQPSVAAEFGKHYLTIADWLRKYAAKGVPGLYFDAAARKTEFDLTRLPELKNRLLRFVKDQDRSPTAQEIANILRAEFETTYAVGGARNLAKRWNLPIFRNGGSLKGGEAA